MKTNNRTRPAIKLILLCAAAWLPVSASAIPVDLELVLAVDGSGSVNDSQFNSQLQGVTDAFSSADTLNNLQGGFSIAPSLVTFSSTILPPNQAVGFGQVNDAATAGSFVGDVNAVTPPFGGNRDIDDVIDFSAPLFAANDFEGTRQALILFSGGIDDSNLNAVANARDDALAEIDAISGVAFEAAGAAGSPSNDVLAFLQNTVIGGLRSFALDAGEFASFDNAVSNAVATEIQAAGNDAAPVPAPSNLLLFALALTGVGFARYRSANRGGYRQSSSND